MIKRYHILNGDSLKQQFPDEIDGEVFVARECFVDGEVNGDTLDELFKVRARFITTYYGDYSIDEYYTDTVLEFEKIKRIPRQSIINLWFEDDLFCQVNFWFVVYLLSNFVQDCKVFLIRPGIHSQYGFGGLNESELVEAFNNRIEISTLDKITSLWKSYQLEDTDQLINTATELKDSFPFILQAVKAHIARIPSKNNPGRPVQTLLEIMNELGTEDFEPVFKEFNKREAIYGFGDLQVKKLLNEIKDKHC